MYIYICTYIYIYMFMCILPQTKTPLLPKERVNNLILESQIRDLNIKLQKLEHELNLKKNVVRNDSLYSQKNLKKKSIDTSLLIPLQPEMDRECSLKYGRECSVCI
jgi:hypothetical protein